MCSFFVDSRVETWPLMQSPIPVFSISFGYILVVYLFPKLLKHRPPLDLKVVLVPYNFALVALSVYMLVEVGILMHMKLFYYVGHF